MTRTITYADLFIPELDQKFIDRLVDERDVDCSELDISYVFTYPEFTTAKLTNAIIYEILYWIVVNNIEDERDQDLLIDCIYTNCLDSGFNVDEDELHTQEAKDFILNF